MLRTFHEGFKADAPDRLRNPRRTKEEQAAAEELEDEMFQAGLPKKIAAELKERRRKGLDDKTLEELEEKMWEARLRRRAQEKKGGQQQQQQFRRWTRSLIIEAMKNSIQAMFYACDYATKPNMLCAPLLVAIRDGLRRLQEQLEQEDEAARTAELEAQLGKKGNADEGVVNASCATARHRPLTKLQDEARRRLIRQATATNQAVVKGSLARSRAVVVQGV